MTPAERATADSARREVEHLRAGDHACHVYESRAEASALAVRFLAAAAGRGAHALWVHPAGVNPQPALAAGGPLVERALAEGAIEIVPEQERLPTLDPELVVTGLLDLLRAVEARGRRELCLVLDLAAAAVAAGGVRPLLAIEARLQAAALGSVTLLYQLDRARVPPESLLALLHAHPLVLHAGHVLHNAEAVPAATLLAGDPPAEALDRLLTRLHEREIVETSLRESEQLFRLLTENARDAVFRFRLVAPRGYEYVSPAFLELTGYSPEDHYREPELLTRIVHPDDRELLRQAPLHATGEPFVLRVVRRDGKTVYTESRSVVLRDDAGRPVAIQGIVRDVTAWVEGEAALRASEARLRSVIASMDEGVIFLDADQRIVECNAAAERILGMDRREFLGRPIPEDTRALRDDGTPFPVSEFPACLTFRTGEPSRALAGLVQRDGSVRWLSIGAEPMPLGPDGRLTGVVASFSDTTAERRAWVEVRRREAQLRLAMECAGHDFWELELARDQPLSGARLVTPKAPELTAAAAFMARVVPEDRPRAVADLEAHIEGRTPTYASEFRIDKGAGPRWMLARGRAVARGADGRALRLAGTVTDVTEVKALQDRLRQADRLAGIGTLAAGIAHEVNNPLAYVAANLAVVEETLVGLAAEPGLPFTVLARLEELRRVVNESRDGARRVAGIIQGLRQFAAPTQGERRAPVDVRAELEAAVGIARNEIAHRARLSVDLAPALPPVSAAPHELGQVFVNLLVHAAQAVPEGRAAEEEVRVAARTDGASVVVEISDTGPGIDPADLPRLFDPYFTMRAPGAGTGLGLSMCHGAVTGLGGTIEVESTPGHGATFRVRLPAAPIAAEPAEARPAARRRGRVLVVDDEPLVARSLSRLLSSAHDVAVECSPLEVLRRAGAGERWDVILCDLMMPELSGMELEARLADAAPDLVPRMTYLTGGAFTERSQAFLAEGRPWLEKPVDPARLRAHVARLVGGPEGGAAGG